MIFESDRAEVDALVAQVLAGSKYKSVHAGLVERIAVQELATGRSGKEAVKSIRRRLHQAGAVYLSSSPRYERWLGTLREAHASGDPGQVMEACRTIMATHQSSRERLPILTEFYQDLLGPMGPIDSIVDLACGLNPLSIPWMPLAAGARYYAKDIFGDLMSFLGEALPLLGVAVDAESADLLDAAPGPSAQVALLLKTVPCLEQIERDAGARIVERVPARHVVVSFPTASLGGRRDRGMLTTYRARMAQIGEGHPWQITEHLYDSELAYLVDKGPEHMVQERA